MRSVFWGRIAAVLIVSSACSSGATAPDELTGDATSTTSGSGGSGGDPSTTTSTGGGGGAFAGEMCPSLGDPCTTCLAAACQATYCTCYQNPECLAATNCLLGCVENDSRCYQACLTAHQAGISDVSLLGDCQVERCSVQCPSSDSLSPCRSCLFQSCPDEMNACVANAACNKLLECVDGCGGDGACEDTCARNHPTGALGAEAVLACGTGQCNGVCR